MTMAFQWSAGQNARQLRRQPIAWALRRNLLRSPCPTSLAGYSLACYSFSSNLPAAAQRPEQIDTCVQPIGLGINPVGIDREQIALGIEEIQIG